jgi:hypothetical protein
MSRAPTARNVDDKAVTGMATLELVAKAADDKAFDDLADAKAADDKVFNARIFKSPVPRIFVQTVLHNAAHVFNHFV